MHLFFRFLTCAAVLVAFAGCSLRHAPSSFSPAPEEARLVELMAQRLELAQKVAWTKFLDNLPIYDPAREAEILEQLMQGGNRRGVSAREVQAFFTAQMQASRQYQAMLLHKWNRGGRLPATSLLDLRADIRPELDVLNREMLETLAKMRPLSKARAPQLAAYAFSTLRALEFPVLPTHTAANSLKSRQ